MEFDNVRFFIKLNNCLIILQIKSPYFYIHLHKDIEFYFGEYGFTFFNLSVGW